MRVLAIDYGFQPARVGVVEINGDQLRIENVATLESIDVESAGSADIAIGLIGRDRVILRRLQLPNVPKDEIAGVVRSEAKRQFDFDEATMEIDHLVSDGPVGDAKLYEPEDHLRIEAAMVFTDFIDRCRQEVPSSGPMLKRLGLRPIAIWQRMTRILGPPEEPVLLANQAGEMVELSIGIGGQVLLSNVAPAGNLVGPTRLLLADFANRFPNQKIERIIFAGDISGGEELAKQLHMDHARFDPLEGIELGTSWRQSLEQGSITAEECLGIAAAAMTLTDHWPLDFLCPKKSSIRPISTSRPLVMVAALAAVLVGGGFIALQWSLAAEQDRIDQLLARRDQLNQELADAGNVLNQYRAVQEASDEKGNCLIELKRLSTAIADKSRLFTNSITFELDSALATEQHIVLSGFAADHRAISEFQQALGGQPIGPVRGSNRSANYRYSFESSVPILMTGGDQ